MNAQKFFIVIRKVPLLNENNKIGTRKMRLSNSFLHPNQNGRKINVCFPWPVAHDLAVMFGNGQVLPPVRVTN